VPVRPTMTMATTPGTSHAAMLTAPTARAITGRVGVERRGPAMAVMDPTLALSATSSVGHLRRPGPIRLRTRVVALNDR